MRGSALLPLLSVAAQAGNGVRITSARFVHCRRGFPGTLETAPHVWQRTRRS